jgi:hypothetical protein
MRKTTNFQAMDMDYTLEDFGKKARTNCPALVRKKYP